MTTSAFVSLNIEDSSSYHLQNGDLLDFVLVSNLLTGDNYNSWCISIEMELKAKNKIGFINGVITQPIESNPLYDVWERGKMQQHGFVMDSEFGVQRYWENNCLCENDKRNMGRVAESVLSRQWAKKFSITEGTFIFIPRSNFGEYLL
ncbi:hypothetical protein F2P56_035646 [Juglans regia]|uniref:Retrotransposon Copia-like N-terminal domain-containing protein n=1 Tax=Juglans regia TaxID=51240 RepID=A0A833TP16_JUGRE|nr:hypothetical protein F2P56_035646 [Juglans regia]